MPLSLKFAKFRIQLEAIDTIHLPAYKGSSLRGALGYALKRVGCTCVAPKSISTDQIAGCVYHYLFEPVAPEGKRGPRGIRHVPQPFILDPPLEEKTEYAPGESLTFEFLLIGKAVVCLPYFLVAIELMGIHGVGKGKGRCRVSGQWILNAAGEATPLDLKLISLDEDGRDLITPKEIERLHPQPTTLNAVTLDFLTPTRLKFGSHLCNSPEFHVLYRNLSRRLSLLSFYHCGGDWKNSIDEAIKRAESIRLVRHRLDWEDWRRYSNRQEREMYLGGFLGRLGFRGELSPFWPHLILGTHLHVGKGATFGLGRYHMAAGSGEDPFLATPGSSVPAAVK